MFSHLLGDIPVRTFSWDEVLSPYIYVFYVAFIVSFIFTPMMRMVALHFGIIDAPDQRRKMHSEPVAYLGGVAVFLGWLSGLAVSQFLRLHSSMTDEPTSLVMKFSIVGGASIIVLLGLWDDVGGVKPVTKIFCQILAAVFLLVENVGTRCTAPLIDPLIRMIVGKFGLAPHGSPEWLIVGSSSVLVVMVVVGCCNASNLIDGLDGLCGGVTAIIAAGLLFVAVHLAMNGGGLNSNWDGLRIVLGLALLGAVLGFVPYNFNPASIFMGDTGSMLLGYACAVMIILMAQGQHPKWFLAAMVMFALPVLDTLLAFARRYVNGRPVFTADRHHFHHQLIARGYTIKQTVAISYALAIFFALLGASIVLMRTRFAGALWLMIFCWIIVAAYKMGMIHEKPTLVKARGLSEAGNATAQGTLESSNVVEVPSPERTGGMIVDAGAEDAQWREDQREANSIK